MVSAPNMLASQPIGILVPAREFLLHSQCDFDCQRRQCLNDEMADRSVERTAVHGLTHYYFRLDAVGAGRTSWAVRFDCNASRSGPTCVHRRFRRSQALQQCRTCASRSTAPFGAPGNCIALHRLQVRLVLLPRYVARMNVTPPCQHS